MPNYIQLSFGYTKYTVQYKIYHKNVHMKMNHDDDKVRWCAITERCYKGFSRRYENFWESYTRSHTQTTVNQTLGTATLNPSGRDQHNSGNSTSYLCPLFNPTIYTIYKN